MKYKKFYIAATLFASLLLVIIVFLRKKNENIEMPPSFTNALKYIDTNPSKTAEYLDMMAADTMRMNEAERMYYLLYKIYAHDKAGEHNIPISETTRLVDYYSTKNKIDSLYLFAMYLQAGGYRDMDDLPQSIEWYIKAVDLGKEKKLYTNRFFERSCFQLAGNYNSVFLADKALAVLKNSEKYIKSQFLERIYYLTTVIYKNKGCPDSSKIYVLKCLPMLSDNEDKAEMVSFFAYLKDTINVKKYKDYLLALNEDSMPPLYASNYVLDKANYYKFIENPDSAIYFGKKVLKYHMDALTELEAAGIIYKQYRKQNNISEAFKYADLYCQLSDSVMRNTESERVSQVGNMYNYQVEQKKANDALRKSNAHLKLALWIIAILVAVVGLVIAVIRLLKKRFNTELADSQHHIHLVKQENEALDKNLETIQQEKASLETENKTLNEKLKVSEELQKQTTEEVANLNQCLERVQKECELAMQKNEQLAMQYAEEKSAEKALADLERLKQRLSVQSSATFTADTWAEVHTTVDAVYPQLHVKLAQHFPQLDLVYTQLLYLSCMSLTLTCVANLLTVYPQALVKRKKRLVDWITKENPRLQINNFEQLLIYLKKEA